jgi:hypothetical protein
MMRYIKGWGVCEGILLDRDFTRDFMRRGRANIFGYEPYEKNDYPYESSYRITLWKRGH